LCRRFNSGSSHHLYIPSSPDTSAAIMSPSASKELRTVIWVFVASFFLTPALLWIAIASLRDGDYSFFRDCLDFYKDMFSMRVDLIFAWVVILVPVLVYEIAVTCCYYYRHPEQLRTVFDFPLKRRRGKPTRPDDGGGAGQ
jgi:hypothetical protein